MDALGKAPTGARKLIRSHVMRGKNAKRRPSREAQSLPTLMDGDADDGHDERGFKEQSVSKSPKSQRASSLSKSSSEISEMMLPVDKHGTLVATQSSPFLPRPQHAPHEFSLFTFAGDLDDAGHYLLCRCELSPGHDMPRAICPSDLAQTSRQ
jgi:hypothetical protein